MSSHDHDNHSSEPKEVSFRTPLILGLVTILIILLAVSTCDKRHDCCEGEEKCETSHGEKHGDHDPHAASTSHSVEATETAPATEEHAPVADTLSHTDTTAVKTEAHAHH